MTSIIWAICIYATLFGCDFFCLRANPAPRAKVTHRGGGICLGSTFFQPGARLTFWRVLCDLMVLWITCSPVWKREWLWKGRPPFTPACPALSLSGNFSRCCRGITEHTKCDWSSAVQWVASPKMMLRVEEKGLARTFARLSPALHSTALNSP